MNEVSRDDVLWFEARDHLFGLNEMLQDVPRALALIPHLSHPDALFLQRLISSSSLDEIESLDREAVCGLLQSCQSDDDSGTAAAFAALIAGAWRLDDQTLLRAAAQGCAAAQGRLSACGAVEWAESAAQRGDRDGLEALAQRTFCLGNCVLDQRNRCLASVRRSELFARAAALGSVTALFNTYSPCLWSSNVVQLDQPPPEAKYLVLKTPLTARRMQYKFCFLVQSALLDVSDFYDPNKPKIVSEKLLVELGVLFFGEIDFRKKTLFGFEAHKCNTSNVVERGQELALAQKAVDSLVRKQIQMWLLVALRLGVVKDIRKVISALIWETRHPELFKLPMMKMEKKVYAGFREIIK